MRVLLRIWQDYFCTTLYIVPARDLSCEWRYLEGATLAYLEVLDQDFGASVVVCLVGELLQDVLSRRFFRV